MDYMVLSFLIEKFIIGFFFISGFAIALYSTISKVKNEEKMSRFVLGLALMLAAIFFNSTS